MGCGHHAVIRLLESREGFRSVDPLFRHLAELFYQIPSCASFGVSCSGHFSETDATNEDGPDCFYPELWGHLNISVVSSEAHIQELLELLKTTVAEGPNASFVKVDHIFGPPKRSEVEIWEMRIGDNGALERFEGAYFGGFIEKSKNKEVYDASKKRYAEIVAFWANIERAVTEFCTAHGFTDLDIPKRVKEIYGKWPSQKPGPNEGMYSDNDPCLTR